MCWFGSFQLELDLGRWYTRRPSLYVVLCVDMCKHVKGYVDMLPCKGWHLVENYANWFELFVLMNSLPPCLEIQFVECSWFWLLSPCRCPCEALGLRPSLEVGGSCTPFVTMRTLEQKQKELSKHDYLTTLGFVMVANVAAAASRLSVGKVTMVTLMLW